MFERVGNLHHGQLVVATHRRLQRFGDRRGEVIGGECYARVVLAQQIVVVAPLQAFGPRRSLGGGEAVENGNGGGGVVLEVAEHGGLGAFVTFVILRGKRQALGEQQAKQENQPEPRS